MTDEKEPTPTTKAGEKPDGDPLEKSNTLGFSLFTQHAATVVAMVTLLVIILLVAWQLITLLLVFFLGILFAIFLRGLSNHLTDWTGIDQPWSLLIVISTLVIVSGITGWFMAPTVSEQASRIAEMIPEAIDQLQAWLETTPAGQNLLQEVGALNLDAFLGGEVLGQVGGAVFGVAGALSHGIFVVAVGLYLAFDPEVYKRGMVRMVPLHYRERFQEIIAVSTHQLAWWLIGRLVAMLAVAVIIVIGLWIIGIPEPIFLGLIAGLLSFVPILGPLVSFIPAALIALTVGPQFVIWVGFLFLGAQSIESYFITPLVQQRVVALPHAMTLIAEVFAGILFGVIGITIATPLAVLLMALINMIYVEDILEDTTPYSEMAEKYHSSSTQDIDETDNL